MKVNLYAALSISCIALVITLVIVGCTPEGVTDKGEYAGMSISSFSYEGHTYIKFYRGHGLAVVHDPQCHCVAGAAK